MQMNDCSGTVPTNGVPSTSTTPSEDAQKRQEWALKRKLLFARIPVGLSLIIDDFLWLGSGKDARDKQMLMTLGITHIFNCAKEWRDRNSSSFIYQCGNVLDNENQDLSLFLEEGISFIDEARKSPQKSRVLVHCVVGKSRSATLTIAYLMRAAGMTLKQAYLHVKSRRDIILPNDGFMRQLMALEIKLLGVSSMIWGEWKDTTKCALTSTSTSTNSDIPTSVFVPSIPFDSNSNSSSSLSPKKSKPQPTPIQQRALDAFVQTHITPEFLQQGVQEVCGGSYDMQFMGEVLKWVNESIRVSTSSAEVLRMEGVTWKDISHVIDKSSKHWLRGHYGMESSTLDHAIA